MVIFIFDKKIEFFFSAVQFFFFFLVIKPLDPDRYRIQPIMLYPDPDQMKTDPKPWRKVAKSTIDGVDAVTTWTHIFFAGENTPAAVKVER